MNLLTIDSTLNKLYISLGGDGFFESQIVESDEQKFHSAYIASTIAKLFQKYKLTAQNLDAVAMNIGPGSFTGIRVGMTVARVMAQAHNLKAVGVSSLEVLSKLNVTGQNTLVLMDARKGKVYSAIFGEENLEPCALTVEDALDLACSQNYFIVADKNITKLLGENSIEALNYEATQADFGKYLWEIAIQKLKSDDDFNWAKLKPLYIQPPPISMPKK